MSPTENHVLDTLSPAAFASIRSHLILVELPIGMALQVADQPVQHVYFLKDGIASVVIAGGRARAEAGIIGRDGLSGHSAIMGDGRSPASAFVQIPGNGLRVDADKLRAAMECNNALMIELQRHVASFLVQTWCTLLANTQEKIDRRLARTLLMAHDRLNDDEIGVTHERLALMVGVRRAGITVALQELAAKGWVSTGRSAVRISDREALVSYAGSIYGISEAEQARLWDPLESTCRHASLSIL